MRLIRVVSAVVLVVALDGHVHALVPGRALELVQPTGHRGRVAAVRLVLARPTVQVAGTRGGDNSMQCNAS